MDVIDASGVLALLRGEAGAERVGALISRAQVDFTAVGVAEAVDNLMRHSRATPEAAVVALADLGLPVHRLTAPVAVLAGRLRSAHYHRETRRVSLADCVVAATALALGTAVATSDRHLLDLCHEEGIDTIPLPDSSGRTWEAPA